MNILLARNIFSKNWFIDPAYVESMMPVLLGILDGIHQIPNDKIVESSMSVIASAGSATLSMRSNNSLDNAQPGSIAIIDVQGALMKNDQFCGPVGMSTIGSWIKQADSHSNIDGIILKMNTPGGTVDGTEELANTVKSAKKPIVAFVDGLMASAGYWIGSAADTIISSGETSWIGSIGVVRAFADMQPALEKAGVKFHEIYSALSPDKNKEFSDSRQGDYESTRTNILDPLAKMFHNAVNTNRSGKLSTKENVLTGKMYFSKDAKKFGLVDSIGTLDDAISFIRNQNEQKMSNKKNRANLNKVLGWKDGAESTDQGTFLQETELDILEEKLSEHDTLKEENASIEALKAAAVTNATTIKTQAEKIQQLEEKVAELGKQPGTRGSQVAPAANGSEIPEGDSPYVDDGSMDLLKKHCLI